MRKDNSTLFRFICQVKLKSISIVFSPFHIVDRKQVLKIKPHFTSQNSIYRSIPAAWQQWRQKTGPRKIRRLNSLPSRGATAVTAKIGTMQNTKAYFIAFSQCYSSDGKNRDHAKYESLIHSILAVLQRWRQKWGTCKIRRLDSFHSRGATPKVAHGGRAEFFYRSRKWLKKIFF